jgi:hypothetical protein
MHIHLPKPLHGWREFVGEVGVVVIGILIALGGEQLVESLHHRSQVHEMTEKLHAESIANRDVIDYDRVVVRTGIADTERAIAGLHNCNGRVSQNIRALKGGAVFFPSNTAWLATRDSALLPLMPDRVADDHWKVDTTRGVLVEMLSDLRRDGFQATAAVETIRGGSEDRAICGEALLSLNRLKTDLVAVDGTLLALRGENEKALRGEPMVIGPAEIQHAALNAQSGEGSDPK